MTAVSSPNPYRPEELLGQVDDLLRKPHRVNNG